MTVPAAFWPLAITSLVFEATVCALALYRQLYRRLPLFTGYLAVLVIRNLVLLGCYLWVDYESRSLFYYFWVTQGLLVAVRAAVIGELAWSAVREYRGVWALGWRLQSLIALLLLLNAAANARGSASVLATFVITTERGLELAVVGILIFLLAFCRYYRIPLEPVQKMVALGMGFYSAIQVLNNSVPQGWLWEYFRAWNGVRVASFWMALGIWLVILRKPLPAPLPAPSLVPQSVYDELAPQVNDRLRVLNRRLLELLKS